MTSSFSSHILARTHNKFLYFYFATNSCLQTFLVDQNINFEPCVILILFSFYRTRKQTKSVTSLHLNGFLVEFREKIAQMNWNYNPGQNPFATNATARQMRYFPSPLPLRPRRSVDVMHSSLFQHNQHCLGEGGGKQ